jgi:hypothetical protein
VRGHPLRVVADGRIHAGDIKRQQIPEHVILRTQLFVHRIRDPPSVVASRRKVAACGIFSRSNSSCLAIEKILVFAPIASASEIVATSVNPDALMQGYWS